MAATNSVFSSALEQRIATLMSRYDAIEKSILTQEKRLNNNINNNSRSSHTKSAEPVVAKKLTAVECAKLPALQPDPQDTPQVAALRQYCIDHCYSSAVFRWVPSEYYSRPLQWRRDILQAPSIHYLCKSIVLENTHCVNEDCSQKQNSRYYCVVFQYTEKFDTEKVMRFVKDMNEGLGKKKFNFRLANSEASAELTGYSHNAVVPFGMKVPMPIILSANITKLQPAYFWMGGGHEDCKLRLDTAQFIELLQPYIVDFTTPLSEEELAQVTE